MTTAVQHRRGTTAEHATFTGLEGEITIDTTKDSAVIHDGILAGGYSLAKESLGNVNPSSLASIDGASTAADDKFLVFDTSALTMKQITRAELNNAMEADALASVTITGGTINGTTIGASTAAAGTFTSLTATGTTSLAATTLTSTVSGGGNQLNNVVVGAVTPLAGSFTTLTTSSTVTLNGGTANGVTYLNGSKVLTSGTALTFDGSKLVVSSSAEQLKLLSSGDFSTTGTGYIRWYDSVGAKGYLGYAGTASQMDLQSGSGMNFNMNAVGGTMTFQTSNAEQMRLTSTGLGIGTSSPTSALTVGAGGIARFNRADNATYNEIKYVTSGDLFYFNQANGGAYQFNISGTEQMRLTSTGLGIGTSSPAFKLQVTGANSSSGGINITGTGTNGLRLFQDGAIGDSYVNNFQNGFMSFATNNTERMRITSTGNVGIGTSSPANSLSLGDVGSIGQDINTMYVGANFTSTGVNYRKTGNFALRQHFDSALGIIRFDSAPSGTAGDFISWSERARIDSAGNLRINNTDAGNYKVKIAYDGGGEEGIGLKSTYSGAGNMLRFINSADSTVGVVSTSNTNTTYATSSDYRLKNTIAPMTGALAKVALLKPVTYKWNADGSDGQGFIAHELAEVVKGCVTGEKDAVDKDGKPQYQGIDTSFLVATLTAAIQEQQALIVSLTSRLDAANL